MELLEHLRRQFAYDAWANGEVLAVIKASGSGSPSALKLLAHILSAERLWLERIMQQPQSLSVWPECDLDQCEAQIAELVQLWREYFGQLSPRYFRKRSLTKTARANLGRAPCKMC